MRSFLKQTQLHDKDTHTYTQTAPVPPGCMFRMFTMVCYSWIKCKIIFQILESVSCLFSSSSLFLFSSLCISLFCFLHSSSAFLSFLSPPLLSDFYFSCHASLPFHFLIVPSLSFSQSIVQGHGIFPWVCAHKIISCWRAGPVVELIASNADNRDKG